MLKRLWICTQRLFFLLLLMLGSVLTSPVPATGAELMVTFTAPGDDGDVGTCAAYLVYYSTRPFDSSDVDALVASGEVDTARFCPMPSIAGSAETCVLTSLLTDTEYWAAIKAVDEVGNWSPLSNVVQARTRDMLPPERITDFFMFAE
jgi:hypothetical protein